MTTIAWDGKTLAADRRVDFNGVSDAEITKFVRNKKGDACASAGSTSLGAAFKRWFVAGEKGERPPLSKDTSEANVLIIRSSGRIEMHDTNGWYEPESTKLAIGSGWEIALGAMAAGATAIEAVEIAGRLDGRTGNNIDTVEIVYDNDTDGRRNKKRSR